MRFMEPTGLKEAVHENVKCCKMPEKHSLDSLDEIKEQKSQRDSLVWHSCWIDNNFLFSF